MRERGGGGLVGSWPLAVTYLYGNNLYTKSSTSVDLNFPFWSWSTLIISNDSWPVVFGLQCYARSCRSQNRRSENCQLSHRYLVFTFYVTWCQLTFDAFRLTFNMTPCSFSCHIIETCSTFYSVNFLLISCTVPVSLLFSLSSASLAVRNDLNKKLIFWPCPAEVSFSIEYRICFFIF